MTTLPPTTDMKGQISQVEYWVSSELKTFQQTNIFA